MAPGCSPEVALACHGGSGVAMLPTEPVTRDQIAPVEGRRPARGLPASANQSACRRRRRILRTSRKPLDDGSRTESASTAPPFTFSIRRSRCLSNRPELPDTSSCRIPSGTRVDPRGPQIVSRSSERQIPSVRGRHALPAISSRAINHRHAFEADMGKPRAERPGQRPRDV